MDEQKTISKNIVDHRKIATHGLSGIFGILLGMLFGWTKSPIINQDLDLVQIVSTALDRGQDFWAAHLEPNRWRMAHVVLIDHDESTACGIAGKESGPFYCPPSERVFVDLSFLRSIHGELARAYVIAHELGHHVQKLLGQFAGRDSISIELQADCYAGLWMRDEQMKGYLAAGDLDGALVEAAAVGDDRLAPGVAPENWTHGSSAQRVAKVKEGYGGGPCNVN